MKSKSGMTLDGPWLEDVQGVAATVGTRSSVRGTTRSEVSCARGGTRKINAEDNGKRPGLCSEDMDDVNKGN